jgi:hypothetical protein
MGLRARRVQMVSMRRAGWCGAAMVLAVLLAVWWPAPVAFGNCPRSFVAPWDFAILADGNVGGRLRFR